MPLPYSTAAYLFVCWYSSPAVDTSASISIPFTGRSSSSASFTLTPFTPFTGQHFSLIGPPLFICPSCVCSSGDHSSILLAWRSGDLDRCAARVGDWGARSIPNKMTRLYCVERRYSNWWLWSENHRRRLDQPAFIGVASRDTTNSAEWKQVEKMT